jgi:hypothetical protein
MIGKTIIHQMFINIIAHHVNVGMGVQDFGDGLQLLHRITGACGVRGAVENQPLGFGRNGAGQGIRR